MAPIVPLPKFTGIALIGPRHSGKTTAAQIAVEDHGFTKIALADPLKDAAVDMLNYFTGLFDLEWEAHLTRAALERNKDEYFRPFLQWLGTDWTRNYLARPTFWIDQFLNAAASISDAGGYVVCDDVRYLNEADALRAAGFVLVRIKRDEDERLASLGTNATGIAQHASETELDDIQYDLLIHNIGLDLLEAGISHVCAMVKHPPVPVTYVLGGSSIAADDEQEDTRAAG